MLPISPDSKIGCGGAVDQQPWLKAGLGGDRVTLPMDVANDALVMQVEEEFMQQPGSLFQVRGRMDPGHALLPDP